MKSAERLPRDLCAVTLDRSQALGQELERLSRKWYPPKGPNRLLDVTVNANKRIHRDIQALLPQLPSLPQVEVALLLKPKAKLLAFLHLLVQFLDGAEVEASPSGFVFPLRRILSNYIPNFDFILRSTRTYNYRVIEIRESIETVFRETGYAGLLESFPKRFFVIECPVAERRDVLMHCIFAHEASHRIYDFLKISDALLPLALEKLDPAETERLISYYATRPLEAGPGEQAQTMEELLHRWRIDYTVRFRLHNVIASWVEELTSDALGLCFLGPAYLFAFVQFAGPFARMDEASDSHPPDRMRIRFACEMLLDPDIGLGYGGSLDGQTKAYIDELVAISAREKTKELPLKLHSLAAGAMEQVSRDIMLHAKNVVKKEAFSANAFKRNVPYLCDSCLALGIPPSQIVVMWSPPGKRRLAKPAAILNAGWIFMLNRPHEYAELLGNDDPWFVRNRIRGLVSKAMEYTELQARWPSRS